MPSAAHSPASATAASIESRSTPGIAAIGERPFSVCTNSG